MSLQLMLHILQLSPCCMKMRSVLCLAEDTAHEALEVLHTRLKAPERSFQDRAALLGPVFHVAMALVQVASVPQGLSCIRCHDMIHVSVLRCLLFAIKASTMAALHWQACLVVAFQQVRTQAGCVIAFCRHQPAKSCSWVALGGLSAR